MDDVSMGWDGSPSPTIIIVRVSSAGGGGRQSLIAQWVARGCCLDLWPIVCQHIVCWNVEINM